VRLALPTAIGGGLASISIYRFFQAAIDTIAAHAAGGSTPGSARKRARPAIAGIL